MSQTDNSVHQALAHLTNSLTPTLLVRTVNRYRGVIEARLGKEHPALNYFDKEGET